MNMYVSNLGFHTSDADLHDLFRPFGQIASAKVITDKVTGKSRGFGFVEMSSQEDASLAIRELDGKDVDGRKINVTAARERPERTDKRQ